MSHTSTASERCERLGRALGVVRGGVLVKRPDLRVRSDDPTAPLPSFAIGPSSNREGSLSLIPGASPRIPRSFYERVILLSMVRSTSAHSSQAFETELRELRSQLLAMGVRCERILGLACDAFVRGVPSACPDIAALDGQIDRDELVINALILRILALRQPVADDLRFLTTALRLITDLERVGDEAVNISEWIGEHPADGGASVRDELTSMTVHAQNMLRDALQAFIDWDDETASRVLAYDDVIDRAFASIVASMTSNMTAGTIAIATGLQVIRAGKCLERIGDHATNVAEEVIFMIRGDDVRHGHWVHRPAAQ